MLGKAFRGGTRARILDSDASVTSLQLCIHFTELHPLTDARPGLDLNAML